jgi:hypothetical protein
MNKEKYFLHLLQNQEYFADCWQSPIEVQTNVHQSNYTIDGSSFRQFITAVERAPAHVVLFVIATALLKVNKVRETISCNIINTLYIIACILTG